jgi:hypothetical protein
MRASAQKKLNIELTSYQSRQKSMFLVLTLIAKWSSIIPIALSSANVAKGKSITISGNIAVADNIARAKGLKCAQIQKDC